MSKKMSNEDFVASARAAHGSRFKYEKCVYDGKKNKLIIICRMHGAFLTHPDTHLKGKHGGCDKCARIQHGRRSSERCRSKVRDLDISDIVKYEPETGDFIWVKNTTIRDSIGRKVGSKTKNGYLECQIQGERYLLHRLAWFMHYGAWPPGEIDHINCIKTDNRIKNLRLATFCENQQNKGLSESNKSGVKGVCWDKRLSKWKARVYASRVLVAERVFDDLNEAAEWIKNVRMRHHKEFSREA